MGQGENLALRQMLGYFNNLKGVNVSGMGSKIEGELRGFRAWSLHRTADGVFSLGSSNNGHRGIIWQPGNLEAQHEAYNLAGDRAPENHAIAHPTCRCGFYAFWTLELLARSNFAHSGSLIGFISAWGRVSPGLNGFRAQKARIEAIARPVCQHDLACGLPAENFHTNTVSYDEKLMTNAPLQAKRVAESSPYTFSVGHWVCGFHSYSQRKVFKSFETLCGRCDKVARVGYTAEDGGQNNFCWEHDPKVVRWDVVEIALQHKYKIPIISQDEMGFENDMSLERVKEHLEHMEKFLEGEGT